MSNIMRYVEVCEVHDEDGQVAEMVEIINDTLEVDQNGDLVEVAPEIIFVFNDTHFYDLTIDRIPERIYYGAAILSYQFRRGRHVETETMGYEYKFKLGAGFVRAGKVCQPLEWIEAM